MRDLSRIAILILFFPVTAGSAERFSPSELIYLGAFAVDGSYSAEGPEWNAYGQRGLTFDPNGDPGGNDEFPGSLWMTGHDYERWVFELSIPTPMLGVKSFDPLPDPSLLTVPTTFTNGCSEGDLLPRFAGIELQGEYLWGSCSERYNVSGEDHAVLWRRNAADFSNLQGPFHIGPRRNPKFHSNRSGSYVFSIPPEWASTHLQGKTLASGNHRNSHGGAMGPTMLAFDPTDPTDGYDVFWYRHRRSGGDDCFENPETDCDFQPNYSACDDWWGAAWVRTATRAALLIGGINCYGGTDYQPGGFVCEPCYGEVLLYDPNDFVARTTGTLKPWEVLPYEVWRPAELWNSKASDDSAGGIGGLAYDPTSGLLYMIERSAEPFGKAIVHVYRNRAQAP